MLACTSADKQPHVLGEGKQMTVCFREGGKHLKTVQSGGIQIWGIHCWEGAQEYLIFSADCNTKLAEILLQTQDLPWISREIRTSQGSKDYRTAPHTSDQLNLALGVY